MGVQKNCFKGDGSQEHPWHNRKTDSESDNLEKWSHPSIQTPVVGAKKNRPTGAIPLHKLLRYGVRSVKYQQRGGIGFWPLNFVFSPLALFRLFAWRLFVISSLRYFVFERGVFSLFRLFAWRFSSFRHFAWRYGGTKRQNNANRKEDEKTKERHAK